MVIIGIHGKLGCGKDYCANIIENILHKHHKKVIQLAFADQLKINVLTKYSNISFHDVYIQKTTISRRLLQTEGTERARDTIDKDIWIKYLDNWISVFSFRGIEYFIISDVRFKSEAEYIKKHGILIKIVAPKRNYQKLFQESNGSQYFFEQIKNHPSECDLDDLDDSYFDKIIYNDIDNDGISVEDLEQEFEDLILNYEKIEKLIN